MTLRLKAEVCQTVPPTKNLNLPLLLYFQIVGKEHTDPILDSNPKYNCSVLDICILSFHQRNTNIQNTTSNRLSFSTHNLRYLIV